ncbi:MAG TPA: glycosyltransferase [Deltaproteobacteria bacterium]|nr:glycosyltransferase [Deltaproteobacteria bacterium]
MAMNLMDLICLAAACIWTVILLLPWRPWATAEFLDPAPDSGGSDLSDITVLIPARNEAHLIQATLMGLKAQGRGLKIVLVDDCSVDDTAGAAAACGGEDLTVVSGEPAPSGWSGKLWALEQGLGHVSTGLILLLDADIELRPGLVRTLRTKMHEEGLHLVSLMAALRMVSFWERLLMPAFIYFFKMLYPFRLSNSTSPLIAAAAGGCILVETEVLREIGGFSAIRGELIDDCALARLAKSSGRRTWIGLSHSARSLRSYEDFRPIWNMVARTAFHQLRYSTLLLLLCTVMMLILFLIPVAGIFFSSTLSKILSATALCAMILTYLPTLRFYGLSWTWATSLTAAGMLYLAMTWTSAVRYWQGRGSEWKGRAYATGKKGGDTGI